MFKKIFLNLLFIPSVVFASNICGDKELVNNSVRLAAQSHTDLSTFDIQNFLTNYIKRGGYVNNKSPGEITQQLKDLVCHPNKDVQLKGYRELADYGDTKAMVCLGDNIREQNPYIALKWYLLAFQKEWIEKQTHNNFCINAIKKLVNSSQIPDNDKNYFNCFLTNYTSIYSLNNFVNTYNSNTNSYQQIPCDFFGNFLNHYYADQVIDYADCKERALKKIMFPNVIITSYANRRGVNLSLPYYKHGSELIKAIRQGILNDELNKLYEIAKLSLEKSDVKDGLFSLGELYDKHLIDLHLTAEQREQKAIEFYKQSSTSQACHALGLKYIDYGFNTNIPQLSKQNFFNEAYQWFSRADAPESYKKMAYLLMGWIKLSSNEQLHVKVKEALVKIDTAKSWLYLGAIYRELKSGEEISNELSHQKAAECFDKVADKGESTSYMGIGLSYLNIGSLYRHNFFGRKLTQEQRQTKAISCFYQSKSPERYSLLADLYYEQQSENGFNNIKQLKKILHLYDLALLSGYTVDPIRLAKIAKKIEKLSKCVDVKPIEIMNVAKSTLEKDEITSCDVEDKPTQKAIVLPVVDEPQGEQNLATNATTAMTTSHQTDFVPQERHEKEFSKKTPVKIQKKPRHSTKIIEENRKNLAKILMSSCSDHTSSETTKPNFIIVFANKKVEEVYDNFFNAKAHKKIKELFEDILENPYSTKGLGRPEVLKGNLKRCLSRHIEKQIRMIYAIEPGRGDEPGKVIIHDMLGYHY